MLSATAEIQNKMECEKCKKDSKEVFVWKKKWLCKECYLEVNPNSEYGN